MTDQPRILVVDDETNMRRILQATLQREGYDVTTAENGHAALNEMKKDPREIVITDLNMPVMDGMTLLKNLSRLYPDTPVIILTAHGTVENAVQAMKEGAGDYITKPFDINEPGQPLRKQKGSTGST